VSLISYTVPCHKRLDDLCAAAPSIWTAVCVDDPEAARRVEVVYVDYGNRPPLDVKEWPCVRVEADYFHMAHARNVGIKAAQGDIIVAFLADQIITPDFFKILRDTLQPGTFLKWHETFVFWREDILAAGGFDERFEFYGPEGKELTDRLQRRGLKVRPIPSRIVSQIPTPDAKKVQHYRQKLSKHAMHAIGMKIWEENQAANLLVANEGKDWGAARCLTSA